MSDWEEMFADCARSVHSVDSARKEKILQIDYLKKIYSGSMILLLIILTIADMTEKEVAEHITLGEIKE